MQLDIQARGFSLTEGLRTHCERRLRFALGAASSRLRSVAIRLSDVNGPRGGVDKRCAIRAIVPGAPPVVIAQYETNIYVAIDRAAERIARSLARRTQRIWRDRRTQSAMLNTNNDGDFLLH
jgi:putative sigma-54 modulation protein